MDIESLSNSELRQSLIDHGIEAGPVTSTTRKLYTKKLAKVYGGKNTSYEENVSYVEQTSQSTSYYEQEQLSSTPQVERITQERMIVDDDDASETSNISSNSISRRDYYPRSYTPTDRHLKRRPLPQIYKESTPIVSKQEKVITKEKVDGPVKKDSRAWHYYCRYILPLLLFLLLLGFIVYSHLEDDTFKMLPFSKTESESENKIH